MARNIEIKARIDDFEPVRQILISMGAGGPRELVQKDIFFACPDGRLKLRILTPSSGELIFYHRPDTTGPKRSDYIISPTSGPDEMRSILETVLEKKGIVEKRRIVYTLGRTRIHLDEVKDLGKFLELEVVLSPDQTVKEAERMACELIGRLGIPDDHLIAGAYIDLLKRD